jgi:hypothetical protein
MTSTNNVNLFGKFLLYFILFYIHSRHLLYYVVNPSTLARAPCLLCNSNLFLGGKKMPLPHARPFGKTNTNYYGACTH